MEYVVRFNIEATNNEAEYEAIVVGLEQVRSLGVRQILVRGFSKLIMGQIRGDCGIKNESLIKYVTKATTLAKDFTQIIFEHIACTENEEVDRLSKLATTYYDELPKEVYIEKLGNVPHQSPFHDDPNNQPYPLAICGIDLVGKLPKVKGSAKYGVLRKIRHRTTIRSGILSPRKWRSRSDESNNIQRDKKEFGSKRSIQGILDKRSLRTTPSHATGETLFSLVYGTKDVLPAELGIKLCSPSKNTSTSWLCKSSNKLSPKWEGPYRVSRVLGPRTYVLEEMDGKPVPQIWQASKLIKFYY
ncbi:hypothetical protein LIER_34765 [Lithospermum erythrorhizon]|uniref:RNase H type-1 domain-containing protein n=1 Tax=Lithospermum erythrorhizon TaxID=34254 RepID=A0AAV3S1S7_LITER